MNTPGAPSAADPPAAADAAAAPDWAAIDHDAACPLCAYSLRGLVEPRCPECGHQFDWPTVLSPVARVRWLFEHARRGGPVAYLVTLARSFCPWRFWKQVKTSQPVVVRRLVLYLLATVVCCALLAAATHFRGRSVVYTARSGTAITVTTLLVAGPEAAASFALKPTLAWPLATLAVFGVYRVSLRRSGLAWPHVLRVVAYAAGPLLLLGPMFLLMAWLRPGRFIPDVYGWSSVLELYDPWTCAAMLLTLWVGARFALATYLYLRLPHGVTMAALAQVAVFLLLLEVGAFSV